MPKDAITLGTHFQAFVEPQVTCGRYGSASEVVRAALRAALIEVNAVVPPKSSTSKR